MIKKTDCEQVGSFWLHQQTGEIYVENREPAPGSIMPVSTPLLDLAQASKRRRPR